MDVLGPLKGSELFADLSPAGLRMLADISIPKKVRKRDVVFLEGQEGHSVFIVVDGRVQLSKTTADGREVVIKVLGPGEMFAEVVLFEEERYPVGAVAVTPGLLLMIPKTQFSCLLENRRFRDDFIAMLMRKQRYLTGRILSVTSDDPRRRFLRFLAEQYGRKERYAIALTKRDIAAAVGVTPETLSRLIRRLHSDGTIDWRGSSLSVRPEAWKVLEE